MISPQARSSYSQRFGNKWNRTRSLSNRWHITTERAGNITGAYWRSGEEAREACVCGGRNYGVYTHYVLAAPGSRLEWEAAPDATASLRAGRARPRPAAPLPLRPPAAPTTTSALPTLQSQHRCYYSTLSFRTYFTYFNIYIYILWFNYRIQLMKEFLARSLQRSLTLTKLDVSSM